VRSDIEGSYSLDVAGYFCENLIAQARNSSGTQSKVYARLGNLKPLPSNGSKDTIVDRSVSVTKN
jgi:hypothetical protein